VRRRGQPVDLAGLVTQPQASADRKQNDQCRRLCLPVLRYSVPLLPTVPESERIKVAVETFSVCIRESENRTSDVKGMGFRGEESREESREINALLPNVSSRFAMWS